MKSVDKEILCSATTLNESVSFSPFITQFMNITGKALVFIGFRPRRWYMVAVLMGTTMMMLMMLMMALVDLLLYR